MAQAFGDLRADWDFTKSSRFRRTRTGTPSTGANADYHIRSDADYLRGIELARDFERNDQSFGQGVERLCNLVVQRGFTLDADTGNSDVDDRFEAKWKRWSEEPDLFDHAGEMTFQESEHLVLRRNVVDGDIVAAGTKEGPLQFHESHRVRSPRSDLKAGTDVVHGFKMSPRRRRLECWVTKDDIDPWKSTRLNLKDFHRLPVRDENGIRQVFHVVNPKFASQTRGISWCAPIADIIGMFADVNFAQLVKAQVCSAFAIFRKRDASGIPSAPATGERSTETLPDGTKRLLEGIGPGMEIFGEQGEELEGFSPNVPNAEFFSHANLLLTFIAINLGIPVAVLLLDPSNTNFSGWRGALDTAREGFKSLQAWLIRRYHRPVYVWKVAQWLTDPEFKDVAHAHETGEINVYRHMWNPPGWNYIQPLDDATADLLRRSNALTSPRRLCGERGCAWSDLYKEIIEDHAEAIEAAIKKADDISKRTGVTVHWRELLPLAGPEGLNLTINTGSQDESTNLPPNRNGNGNGSHNNRFAITN